MIYRYKISWQRRLLWSKVEYIVFDSQCTYAQRAFLPIGLTVWVRMCDGWARTKARGSSLSLRCVDCERKTHKYNTDVDVWRAISSAVAHWPFDDHVRRGPASPQPACTSQPASVTCWLSTQFSRKSRNSSTDSSVQSPITTASD